jgi:hypothetical protein
VKATLLKIDHPSFFHSFHLIRADGGFLPGGEPSSLSESAGNASAPLAELGPYLNAGTPHHNKLALSSIADIRRNSPDTSDSKPQPKANKMASNLALNHVRFRSLQTVRSHDKNK